jgi:hypothetical protein
MILLDIKDFKIIIEEFCKKTGLDFDDAEELYDICINEINENCENIKNYYKENLKDEIRHELHNIRGVSGSYMLNDIYSLSKNISKLFSDEKKLEFINELDKLCDEIEILKKNLKIIFN